MKILKLLLTLLLLQSHSPRLIVDESLYYFTNLNKLENLLKNRNLMECIFLEKSKFAINIDCFKNQKIADIEKHYTEIIGKIIKNILKDDKKDFCYNLNQKISLELCQNIIRKDFSKFIKLDLNSIKKQDAFNRIISVFMQYFKILINHGKENLKNLNKKPFFEDINSFIEKEIVDVVGQTPLTKNDSDLKDSIIMPFDDIHQKGKNILGFSDQNLRKIGKHDLKKIEKLEDDVQGLGFYNHQIPLKGDIYYKQNLEEGNLKGEFDQMAEKTKNGLGFVRGEISEKKKDFVGFQNSKIESEFEMKKIGDLRGLEKEMFGVLGNIKNGAVLKNEIVLIEEKLEVILKKTTEVTVLKKKVEEMEMGRKKERKLGLLREMEKELANDQKNLQGEIFKESGKYLKKQERRLEDKIGEVEDAGKKNEILEGELEDLKKHTEDFEDENKKIKEELKNKIDKLKELETKEGASIDEIKKLQEEITDLKNKEKKLIELEMLEEKTEDELKKAKMIQEDIDTLNTEKTDLDDELKTTIHSEKAPENQKEKKKELTSKIDLVKINKKSEGIEKQILINDIISKLESSKESLLDIGLNNKFLEESNKTKNEVDLELEKAYKIKEKLDYRVEKNDKDFKEEISRVIHGEEKFEKIKKDEEMKNFQQKKEKEKDLKNENLQIKDQIGKIEEIIKKDDFVKKKLLKEEEIVKEKKIMNLKIKESKEGLDHKEMIENIKMLENLKNSEDLEEDREDDMDDVDGVDAVVDGVVEGDSIFYVFVCFVAVLFV